MPGPRVGSSGRDGLRLRDERSGVRVVQEPLRDVVMRVVEADGEAGDLRVDALKRELELSLLRVQLAGRLVLIGGELRGFGIGHGRANPPGVIAPSRGGPPLWRLPGL